ncbi:MAG: hypothetical protein R3E82_16175 [Pseudomonadales bacterium]|nr:hypothetical protein [Pseudomonadales bacterium]
MTFLHPRSAGTYARVLGHYVRDGMALPVLLAMQKMTLDQGTCSVPERTSAGMIHTLVSGQSVVRDGVIVPDVYPGQAIRSEW